MKLHLLRHAKAATNSGTGKDIDRPLSERGIRQFHNLNTTVLKTTESLDVWCSQAIRTRKTCASIDFDIDQDIEYSLHLYLASRNTLLQSIWERSGTKDLLIIGHNFGISQLAEYFLEQPIELKTAEFLSLDFGNYTWEEVSRGLATISHRYRPSS